MAKETMAIVRPRKGNVVFNAEERWIILGGPITEETATWFSKFFIRTHTLNKDWRKPIIVFIDSKGGDAIASLQIHSMLRASILPTTTIVVKKAYSGALTISQGGSVRKTLPGAKMAIHETNYSPPKEQGHNFGDLFLMSDKCLRVNNFSCRVFSQRTKLGLKKISQFLYENETFTAEEAKKYNFVDEIIKPDKEMQTIYSQKVKKFKKKKKKN